MSPIKLSLFYFFIIYKIYKEEEKICGFENQTLKNQNAYLVLVPSLLNFLC